MEEILASIRRIIADDQPLPLTPRATAEPPTEFASPRYVEPGPAPVARAAVQPEPAYAPRPASALPPAAPVFQAPPPMEASRPMEAPGPVEAAWPVEAAPVMDVHQPEASRAVEPPAAVVAAAGRIEDNEAPLVSAATDASVATAFQALAATRLMPTGDALNEIVRDMLRPMLKSWLDDNLPVLVERLVRAEIERVARGGR